MDEKIDKKIDDLSYVKVFNKIIRFLFGVEKPPVLIRIMSIILIAIHLIEFLLFSLVSVFVLLSPDRYYQKSVLEDFAELGDDFFYAFTLLQVVLFCILLFVWRKKIIAMYFYTIFSMVEIIIPYFLVKNTGFPWVLLLVNLGVILSLFYLIGKENKIDVDKDIESNIDSEEVSDIIEQ